MKRRSISYQDVKNLFTSLEIISFSKKLYFKNAFVFIKPKFMIFGVGVGAVLHSISVGYLHTLGKLIFLAIERQGKNVGDTKLSLWTFFRYRLQTNVFPMT